MLFWISLEWLDAGEPDLSNDVDLNSKKYSNIEYTGILLLKHL